MKALFCLIVLISLLGCSNKDNRFKYSEGDIVCVSFDDLVSMWARNSDDTLLLRKILKDSFDTINVKAKIVTRFYSDYYRSPYYQIIVFNLQGEETKIPPVNSDFLIESIRYIPEQRILKIN